MLNDRWVPQEGVKSSSRLRDYRVPRNASSFESNLVKNTTTKPDEPQMNCKKNGPVIFWAISQCKHLQICNMGETILVGGFNYILFSSLFGEDSHLTIDNICQRG